MNAVTKSRAAQALLLAGGTLIYLGLGLAYAYPLAGLTAVPDVARQICVIVGLLGGVLGSLGVLGCLIYAVTYPASALGRVAIIGVLGGFSLAALGASVGLLALQCAALAA